MEKTCETCRFGDDVGPRVSGWCRRYAPRPRIIDASDNAPDSETEWPRVAAFDWCGEWAPVERPAEGA